MTGTIERIAVNLAIMLVAVNLMLWVGGAVTASQVPTISKVVGGIDLDNYQDGNFQKSLLDENMSQFSSQSSGVTILDFLENIPFLGPVITILRIVYELMFTLAFGVVGVLIVLGAPPQITIPIGGVLFVIYAVALGNFLLRVIANRGGSST